MEGTGKACGGNSSSGQRDWQQAWLESRVKKQSIRAGKRGVPRAWQMLAGVGHFFLPYKMEGY